jgi:hypothetical protein
VAPLVGVLGAAMVVTGNAAIGGWIAGGALALWSAATWWARRDLAGRWAAGAAGEREAAAALAGLERRGWAVFSDRHVPGRRGNLDHLVVGPGGIVVVETKRWQGEIRLGRRHLRVDGERRSEVLDQVRRQVDAIEAALGRPALTAGVLCITGPRADLRRRWWQRHVRLVDGVPVGRPDDVVRRLRRARVVLAPREVADWADRVARGFPAAG